ncbi:DUF1643 domain-containing protein [Pseudoxanthomonas winnipegensis]|uniref:DUF1643 domain-containing protein n=1 Tax=Pseudoxanthomonas winnipegensis TaxID=2480810 RepID=A0ABY1WCY4_9GAMM|nr:DUF1643 domain-containing protein [Pseudoxanthomonas winnipegensis]TAA12425.1 DUF1643 domain-containing protein [Pseudoxanthomonas winnipegensis]TAA19209.1 DUF1643 domain-containing protein [Pseudoxanthomonas winnipegensis]TAH70470.1 DUF1643 domain-containing protein [Pseudoxanthomonas winnipegensis]
MAEFNIRDAMVSPCGRYRYSLGRAGLLGSGTVLFVMLNPSTADADVDDPTIRRCVSFAASWGFKRLEVANLFAFRATDPKAMALAEDPVGPDNDLHLMCAAARAGLVICAWGVNGVHLQRAARVRAMLTGAGHRLHHLGLTKDGHPKHPLYLAAATEPQEWV